MRQKGNGNKKSHGAKHMELFIMVGENRIELVPQRTSFEGAKRRANDRERGCRRLYDFREKREMAIKNPTERITWNFLLWWAKTGSNWFRSEHILKEQSDAQNVVSRGCRRLYDCRGKKEKGKKKAPRSGSRDAFFWWAKTGSNWFRSEHILKEQSDAQNVVSRGCRRLYDCRGKREMAIKNPTERITWNFSLWWAKTGSNWFRSEHHLKEQSDAQMIVSADAGGYMTVEKKGKWQ